MCYDYRFCFRSGRFYTAFACAAVCYRFCFCSGCFYRSCLLSGVLPLFFSQRLFLPLGLAVCYRFCLPSDYIILPLQWLFYRCCSRLVFATMMERAMQEIAASQTILRALAGRPGFAKVSSNESAKLRNILQTVVCTTADLGKIGEAIRAAGFQADHEGALLDVVAERAATPACAAPEKGSHRVGVQNYLSFVNFVKASTWQSLREGEHARLTEDLLRLGLRNPSEATSQTLGLVILHQTEGFEKAMQMTQDARLEFVRSMKALFKSKIKAAPADPTHLLSLPETPQELLQVHPDMYNSSFASEGPAKSPISDLVLPQLRRSTRMRALRGGASPSALSSLAIAPDMLAFGQTLMMQMQGIAQQVQSLKRQPSQPLIRLNRRLLGGASREGPDGQQLALASPRSPALEQEQLALRPSPRPPALWRPAVEIPTLAAPAAQSPAHQTQEQSQAPSLPVAADLPEGRSVDEATLAILNSFKEKKEAKCKASAKPKAKATPVHKKPAAAATRLSAPPLSKQPPVYIGTCTVYTDDKKRQWRAVEASNRRRDVKFSWKQGDATKERTM